MNKEIIGYGFNKVYKEVCTEILNCPDRTSTNRKGEKVYEKINFGFTLTDVTDCFATVRRMSMKYLQAEFDAYREAEFGVAAFAKASTFWEKLQENDKINSNYGKLLFRSHNARNRTQIEHAIDCLLSNPESKKAVAVIYRDYHAYISKDNPCTMFIQFFIIKNKLNIYVKMRSSDMWFGAPYDVPFFVLVQHIVWNYLKSSTYPDLQLGSYSHNAGSLHIYDRNKEELLKNLKDVPSSNKLSNYHTYILPEVVKWNI